LKPLVSVGFVVAAAAVAVSRRWGWGSMAKADAARARIMLVSFIVSRKFVRKKEEWKNRSSDSEE
jgi:hypothetical protein